MSDLTPQQITVKEYKEIYGNFDKERLIQILIEDKLYIKKLHEQLYAESKANGVVKPYEQALPMCGVSFTLSGFRKWQKDNWSEIYLMSDEFMIKTYLATL